MDQKSKIRSKFLKIRQSIPEAERELKDARIAARLESLDVFKKAHNVLFYYSVNGEVNTRPLIDKWLEDKQLYLPVIRGKSHFQAVPIQNPLGLKKSHEGIPEPILADPNSIYDHQVELVIVPGVAFDHKGNRLGMGKGYYDRYLAANAHVVKIGLAYEEQILEHLPKEPYDVRVDFVVTEERIYKID